MPGPELTWISENRFAVGSCTFGFLPAEPPEQEMSAARSEYFVFKPRALVERYAELIAELRPRHLVELGVREGGSTVFLSELARPERLVGIDRRPPTATALREYLATHGYEETVTVYDDVDQSDRARLAEIIDDAFGEEPLDLVFDDCSHLYEPTRASFNGLFPRLRPGGLYVIEDWRWAHSALGEEPIEGMWPEETPLTRLLFELALGLPSVPGLIRDISVNLQTIEVRRGHTDLDPSTFDISECSNPRGRALLSGART